MSTRSPAPAIPPKTGVAVPFLQHKCACGNSTSSLYGRCHDCRNNEPMALQAKHLTGMSISTPGDRYETEADRIASQVTGMASVDRGAPMPPARNDISDTAHIQLAAYTPVAHAPNAGQRNVSHETTGLELAESAREYFEPRFGHDLRHVRIHDDSRSHASAQALRARAYTVGNHIYFNRGQLAPDTSGGKRLLAHEIAHVIQQSGGQPAHTGLSAITALGTDRIQPDWIDDLVGILDEDAQRVVSNLRTSVEMSPRYFTEIFVGEVLDAVLENWVEVLAVTVGLIAAEGLISVLAASPTGISQFIAAVLQVIVIAILGSFATIELGSAVTEGMMWYRLCSDPNAGPEQLAEAARAFLRMLRHIVLAILILAGVRARVRGAGVIRDASAARGAALESSTRPLPPGEPPPGVTRLSSHPDFRPAPAASTTPPPRPVALRAASGGAQPAPVRAVPQPVPEPLPSPPAAAPTGIPNIGPRAHVPVTATDVVAATGPGVSFGTRTATDPDVDRDLDESSRRGECTYESVAQQFGRYPCHADYARSLSGVSREVRVTTPEGINVDFDAMDHGGALYEVKTGYRWMAFMSNPTMQQATITRFYTQAATQREVAARCGHPLTWYFNDPYAASFFDAENAPYPEYLGVPMPIMVWYRPFDCSVDSDD